MRTNIAVPFTEETHEGGKAHPMSAEQALRRSVMACMLWENDFYEDGEEIAKRIATLSASLPFEKVAAIALEAREKMKLRHASLWLTTALIKAKHQGRKVGDLIAAVCQRADEPAELLSMYWKGQPQAPLPKQLKLGLARALAKFDEYQLAKYNRDGAVKLRDVLFLSHAKPNSDERTALYKRIAEKQLATPDTWEVALSGGADKKETFERLMAEKKLFALAFLRNLRNMEQAGISKSLVAEYASTLKIERVLPFRFITAARVVPQWEDMLEPLMMKCLAGQEKLKGRTVLLLDVSGSMDSKLSQRGDTTRMDAGFGIGVLLRELCEEGMICTFSNTVTQVPPRRGFALRDAMKNSQPHSSTYLAQAVTAINSRVDYDRMIIVTDEQSHDGIASPKGRGYVINVASNKNGVGYGQWLHIDGWSEAVIDYIKYAEAA